MGRLLRLVSRRLGFCTFWRRFLFFLFCPVLPRCIVVASFRTALDVVINGTHWYDMGLSFTWLLASSLSLVHGVWCCVVWWWWWWETGWVKTTQNTHIHTGLGSLECLFYSMVAGLFFACFWVSGWLGVGAYTKS